MKRRGAVLGLMCVCTFVLGTGVAHGQSAGRIVAWGADDSGLCNVPVPNADFVAVSGADHNLGLKSDGTIVAWGRNWYGQCNVPAPNADFVAVAAGEWHSLGLKSDGTIVGWGYNAYGQCDVPAPNAGFVAVAAGYHHSLGLKSDGTIVAWGWISNVPAPNADFVTVSAGGGHNLGLKSDGTIVAWGWNEYGQCNVPAPNADFVAVSGGLWHSLGLKSDGTIVAWGSNSHGQCNVPAPNPDFLAVTAGFRHSLALALTGPGYTPEGTDVVVSPEDSTTGAAPITVCFDRVTVWGVTTLTISDQGPPPDGGFKMGTPPTYYEVTTTAVFVDSIDICIDYGGISFRSQESLKVAHWEGDQWVQYDPTAHDTVDSLICVRVPYLSTFAIFEPIPFTFDVKPGSCPNPFNLTGLRDTPGGKGKDPGKSLNKGGVLPTAIVGTVDFEVTEIDVSTVRLMGAEPEHHAYEDVATPAPDDSECTCTSEGPDGFVDLKLKFPCKEIAGAIVDVEDGDVVPLTLTGSLTDGSPFAVSDCVLILSGGQDMPPGASEDAAASREIELGPATPNPFKGVTRITYWLPSSQSVKLSIFDAAGRLVKRLVEEVQGPGEHVAEWDASGVPSGIYFCRIQGASQIKVMRIRHVR